jgi:IS1 family transposase
MDELRSFGQRDNEQWVWLAIDTVTREIVGYVTFETGVASRLKHCGSLCLRWFATVACVISIFSRRIPLLCQASGIAQ